jgi:LysM domain/Penicillin-insensitive murein endopeptidase
MNAAIMPKAVEPRPAVPRMSFAELNRLGSLSVGKPNTGYLVNGVRIPNDPDWVLTVPTHGYGTQEAVEQLQHCLHRVHEQYPGSSPVMLGSMSSQFGGKLPPHKSHRSGRDVDVYFFRSPDAKWNRAATKEDLDLPRTWTMLKCFVSEADVDLVLIDHKVQAWLEAYALSAGEPEAWVRGIFHDRPGTFSAPVRHVSGHVAHMHVRFVSPEARRRAVQNYDRLVASGFVAQGMAPVRHVVQKGDTLLGLAKRYQVSVEQIRSNNQLKGTTIRVGQALLLQQAVELEGARDPVWVPPRHLPTKSDPVAPGPPPVESVTLRADEPDLTEVSGS